MTGENGIQRVASLKAVEAAGCLPVQAGGHTLALFAHGGRVWAVDNRCPHMGFPLSQGTVKDGILTCHWHHARFDLATGGVQSGVPGVLDGDLATVSSVVEATSTDFLQGTFAQH